MKYKLKSLLISATVLLPLGVNAQYLTNTGGILNTILGIVNQLLIPIAFSLALLYFFYGMAKYIWSVGSEKEQGKQIMIWGVVALFVMSSIWGLVFFIRDELSIGSNTDILIPRVNK